MIEDELFIRVKDGVPVGYPILGSNFRDAFPDIDVNNLPPTFARYQRTLYPSEIGFYQVAVNILVWNDGVVNESWSVRDMTQEEKDIKDSMYKSQLLQTLLNLKSNALIEMSASTDANFVSAMQNYINNLNLLIADIDNINIVAVPWPFKPYYDVITGNLITNESEIPDNSNMNVV
jgi:hypothetical protein